MRDLLARHDLAHLADRLMPHVAPAIGMTFTAEVGSRSQLGGAPLLPAGFEWPTRKLEPPAGLLSRWRKASGPRPLDHLLQLDLAELGALGGPAAALPDRGLLTFFYDMHDQPWGYDPAHLDGFRVVWVHDVEVDRMPPPPDLHDAGAAGVQFHLARTLPWSGSLAAEALDREAELPDAYFDALYELEAASYNVADPPLHRLFGHSAVVQDGMELQAQLTTHGLYTGNSSGYADPRRKALEAGATDWVLLLQLDSDDDQGLMWGDCGRLYYWIRRQDLAARRFDRAWCTLQCA